MNPGTQLGPYEIIEPLGAGGMGEVYRARDTRLGRDVALKVLPAELADDPERLARLEREARLLAALNHPNIASIYGLEETDEGRPALVLELIEGPTLADRIQAGPLPVEEALEFGIQIARALETAHKRGIVHRDLKPSNVKITPSGDAKVLDFGLAKAVRAETGDSESELPTATVEATRIGTVLGTAPYMSPEQVRGEEVDERTDIWALGCTVYEMLTSQRAFAAETASETLAAVLKEEPDWERLPSPLPPSLRGFLHRSLAKELDDRLHHAADARLELTAGLEEAVADPGPLSEPSGARRSSAAFWVLGLAMAIAGLLAGFFVGALGRPDPTREATTMPGSKWQIDLGGEQALDLSGRSDPIAISRDGTTIAYVAQSGGTRRVYLRPLEQLEPVIVTGSEDAQNPFFSHDGTWLGFFARRRLMKAPVSGGAPVTVCRVPVDSLGATWGEDGTIVFASYGSGLWRVDADGGEPRLLASEGDRSTVQHRWPQLLPGGREVLFTLQTSEGPRPAIYDLEREEVSLIPGLSRAIKSRYLSGGQLIFAQGGSLFGVRFDPTERALTGTPKPLVGDVSMSQPLGVARFAVSDDGTLVFASGDAGISTTLQWTNAEGKPVSAVDEPGPWITPRLSPDGSRLVVEQGVEVGDRQLVLLELRRDTRTQLTFEGRNGLPAWHPDGSRIAFASDRGGDWDLFLLDVDAGGDPTLLVSRPFEQWTGSWSPNGRYLAYYEVHPESARDIRIYEMEADPVDRPFLATRANERAPMISPDGRWLAYVSDESGRDEIYVRRFPDGSGKWTISSAGGVEPVWSPTGERLFYRERDKLMEVSLGNGSDVPFGTPRPLFEREFVEAIAGNPNYDVSRDGRRFVVIQQAVETSSRLNVFIGWGIELERTLSRSSQ